MKYLKYFESITSDDLLDIKDLFQDIADKYFIKYIGSRPVLDDVPIDTFLNTDDNPDDSYSIFIDKSKYQTTKSPEMFKMDPKIKKEVILKNNQPKKPKYIGQTSRHRICVNVLMTSMDRKGSTAELGANHDRFFNKSKMSEDFKKRREDFKRDILSFIKKLNSMGYVAESLDIDNYKYGCPFRILIYLF